MWVLLCIGVSFERPLVAPSLSLQRGVKYCFLGELEMLTLSLTYDVDHFQYQRLFQKVALSNRCVVG